MWCNRCTAMPVLSSDPVPIAPSAPAMRVRARRRTAALIALAIVVAAALGALAAALLASLGAAAVWLGAATGAIVAAAAAATLWLAGRSHDRAVPAAPSAPTAQRSVREPLTGAYTQAHFVAAADREWARLRRRGEDAALLLIDVDRYARLNEIHGREFGDALFDEVTRLAVGTLRPYDLLARFGGGVLVVYLPHTDPIGALDAAERIRERVAALRLVEGGKTASVTVSIGVAPVGEGHGGLDAVIADAGIALRDAKAAGRNCVRSTPIPPRRSPASPPAPDRRRAGPV